MLNFAAICPHPPIIIPSIGGSELAKVKKTAQAMQKLAQSFAAAQAETVMLISPHGPVQANKMTITASLNMAGDFAQFGDWETQMDFKNDLALVQEIEKAALAAKIPLDLIDFRQLDHGALVPLYYLTKKYSEFKLIPLAFSFLDYQAHFRFGQIIGQRLVASEKRYAIVASGDLSHRVTKDAPAGYSPRGKEFDEKLIALLQKNNIKGILNLDENLIEEAGECGLRSIIILLGALSLKTYQFSLLNYEAPFGVGYLVAQYC